MENTTPRFDTEDECLAHIAGHGNVAAMIFCSVHITEELMEKAKVTVPGFYIVKDSFRRWLPLKEIIVRQPLQECLSPKLDLPREAYAST